MKNESNENQIRIRSIKNDSSSENVVHTPRKKRRLGKIITFLLFVAVIALSWAYYNQKKELDLIKDPQARAEIEKKEVESTISKASKIIILPSDETPQIFTINDADTAVKEQPAFKGVVSGDKIMLYTKSNKAIIYSPSRSLIVNVLPVTISGGSAGTSGSEKSSASKPASSKISTSTNDNN